MFFVFVALALLASASAQTIRVDANQADISIGNGRSGGLAIQIANDMLVISHGTAADATVHQISYNRIDTSVTTGDLSFTGAWKTLSSVGANDLPGSGSTQRQAAFDRLVASGTSLVVGHCANGLITTYALDATFTYQKCEDLGPSNNPARLPSDMLPWASQPSYLHGFGWNMAMPRDADHFFATTYRKTNGRMGIAIYNLFTLDSSKVRCSPSLWRTVTIRSTPLFDWSKASCKVQILPRFPSTSTAANFANRIVLAAVCYSSSSDASFLYRRITDYWSWPADQTGLPSAPAITAHRAVEFVTDTWNRAGFTVGEIYPTSFKCNFDIAGSTRDFRAYVCSVGWQLSESSDRWRYGVHTFTFENGVSGSLADVTGYTFHLHYQPDSLASASFIIVNPVSQVAPGPRSFAAHAWSYKNLNVNRVYGGSCALTSTTHTDAVTGDTVTREAYSPECWAVQTSVDWPNTHAFVAGDQYIQNRVRYVHPTAERVLSLMVIMPSPSFNTMFLRVGKLITTTGANVFIPATYSGISRYLNANSGMQYADDAATTFSDRDGDLMIPDSVSCDAGPSKDATQPGYLPDTRCTGPGQSTIVDIGSGYRALTGLSSHRPVRQIFSPHRNGLSMFYTRPVTCSGSCGIFDMYIGFFSTPRFDTQEGCGLYHAPVRTGSVTPGTLVGLYNSYLCDYGYDNWVEHYTIAGSTKASRYTTATANRQVFRYVKTVGYGGAFTAVTADGYLGSTAYGLGIVCGDAVTYGCSIFTGANTIAFIDTTVTANTPVNIYVNGADSVKFDDYWVRLAGGAAASTFGGRGYIAYATYYRALARPTFSSARVADFCGPTATLRYTCPSPAMYAYIASGLSLRIKAYKSNAVDGTGFPEAATNIDIGCVSDGSLTYGIYAHEAKIEIVGNYLIAVFCRDAYRATDPLLGYGANCGYKTYELNDGTYTPRGAECMYEIVQWLYSIPIDTSRRVAPAALTCRMIDNGPTIRCAVFFAPAVNPVVFDPLSTSTATTSVVTVGGNAIGEFWTITTNRASVTVITPNTGAGTEPPTPYGLHSTETGFFYERMFGLGDHGFQMCTWAGQCWAPLHTYTAESAAGFMAIVPGVESGLMVVNRIYSTSGAPTTANSYAYVVLSGQSPVPENWRVPLGLTSGLSWQSPYQTTPLSGTTKCAGGTYSINGQTCAVSCPAGRYRPGSGESLYCLRCPGGTFRTDVGWASCANVAVETSTVVYSGSTAAGSTCTSPTYAPNVVGTPKCQVCPPGQFYNAGTKGCASCAIGTASSTNGAAGSCPACAAGKYMTTTGATACLDCPAGRAEPGTGQSVVCSEVCQQGFFSNAGQSTCSSCPAGTRSGTGQITACSQCGLGTFSLGGTETCTNCGAGTYNDVLGASVCKDCAAGSASSDIARTTPCGLCGIGFFTATPGRTAPCDTCGPGLTNFAPGSVSCSNCNYGEEVRNSTCQACRAGLVFLPTQLLCGFCPKDFRTTSFNQTTCTQCSPGTISIAGSTECDACDNGKYEDITKAGDIVFPGVGLDGNGTCSDCPPNSQNTGTGNTRCGQCVDGFGFSSGGCTTCQTGFYSNASVEACTACPAGFFSSISGSTKCDICLAGTFSAIPGSSGCAPCTSGSYCPFNGTSTPLPCPASTFTVTTGNVACQNCTRGTALSTAEAAQCGTCVPGQYQLGIGTPGTPGYTECVTCGNGIRTDSQGISVCQNCSAGFQQTVSLNLVCTACPEGRFSSSAGSTICRQCRAGWFQDLRGQTTEKPCATGRFTASTGQSVCQFCSEGRFASSLNSSTCTDCLAGSFASVVGSTQCTPCRLETFAGQPASATCSDCPRGTYGTTTGQTICRACLAGQYQNNEGSVGCIDCAAGTFSSTNGSAQCTPCSTYFYAANQASTACTECPPGYIGNADNSGCVIIPGVVPDDEPVTRTPTAVIVGLVVGLIGAAAAVALWCCYKYKKKGEERLLAVQEMPVTYQQGEGLPPSLPQPLNVMPDYRTMSVGVSSQQ